jgi:hypothetical protein
LCWKTDLALSVDSGFSSCSTSYVVLEDGVVTSVDWQEDLNGGRSEAFRALREPAFFEACVVATDLAGILLCLLPVTPSIGCPSHGPADLDACIDAEPICPE